MFLSFCIASSVASAAPAAGPPPRKPAKAATSGLLEQGEAALQARDWAHAEQAFRAAIARMPKSARAHSDLAIVLTLSGRVGSEALSESAAAAKLAPSDPTYLVRYGTTLEAAGRLVQAREQFEKARRAQPHDRQILMLLADCSSRIHDPSTAQLLRQVISEWPENRRARTELAEFYWNGANAGEGDGVMEEAIRREPRDPELHAIYGESLLHRLQFTRAIGELTRARELGLAGAPLLNALGEANWEAHRTDDARAAFEASIAADPNFFPSRLALGRLLLWSGKFPEAAEALRQAVRLKEDSAPAQWNLGRALSESGDLAGAEKALRRAAELQPKSSRFHYTLATVLAAEKSPDAAAEFARYKETSDAEQNAIFQASSRRVDLNGALDLLHRGKADEALARFRELPESVESLEGQAEAFSIEGRHSDAIRCLERAGTLAPDDAAIRAVLAHEYAAEKEKR